MTTLYILFNHALFGQGIRSLLRGRRAIQIVGMGKDEATSLKAMRSLRPEVIIVEQSNGEVHHSFFDLMFQQPAVGRVVALNIDHNHATVYDRRAFVIANPEDLVNAIRTGRGTQELTSPARCGLSKRPPAGTAQAKPPPRQTAQQRAKS